MKKILIVVDMQNDFVTGTLANEEAAKIIPNVVTKVKLALADPDTKVFFTMDTHHEDYLETEEGKNLPIKHCMDGTKGQEIIDELQSFLDEENVAIFEKDTFGSVSMIRAINSAITLPTEIELIGVCTDICVITNALLLKTFFSNIPIYVDSSCCAGVTPEGHDNAINAMYACHIHIQ